MCDDLIKTILGMLAAKQIVIIPSKDFKFFIIHPKSLIKFPINLIQQTYS